MPGSNTDTSVRNWRNFGLHFGWQALTIQFLSAGQFPENGRCSEFIAVTGLLSIKGYSVLLLSATVTV